MAAMALNSYLAVLPSAVIACTHNQRPRAFSRTCSYRRSLPLGWAHSSALSGAVAPSALVPVDSRARQQAPGRRPITCGLFGLGAPEVAVIAGVALLLFGPKKLPELGKNLGRTVKSFQEAAGEFEKEIKQGAAEFTKEVKASAEELQKEVASEKDSVAAKPAESKKE